MSQRRAAVLLVVLAAVVPYLPTLDDYFIQDDFGVVWLLSTKPAAYFPRWFVSPWMDDIWGYMPDEIRPFTAVTYQVAALWGAGSPTANHAINIGFHAINSLLVFAMAGTAAGLSLWPAAFAAMVFAVLPMQTESVAWITGRVDSMPACFYFASFLLYVHWRRRPRASIYVWSVGLYFVALFTKQNTVTLPAALLLYDALVDRRPVRLTWVWLKPYIPFMLLTAGYLGLRYALFGEVAREGTLTADRVELFLHELSGHLRRMAFGGYGLQLSGLAVAARVAAGIALIGVIAMMYGARAQAASTFRAALYFLIVWIGLGAAPTLVAGYASPRHMYLAAAGWAVALGCALGVLWHTRHQWSTRVVGGALGAAVLLAYGLQLRADIRAWGVRADVSRVAVDAVEREAMAAVPGTLIIVDAPRRSWDFAVPYAFRPPFTGLDLLTRVAVVSHSSMHCCPANVWEPHTRQVLRTWQANPAHPPVIALRWDETTGQLFRLHDSDDPFLRTAVLLLLEAKDVSALDRLMLEISRNLAVRLAARE